MAKKLFLPLMVIVVVFMGLGCENNQARNFIVFDGNGGVCTIEPFPFVVGEDVGLDTDPDLITREGYVFGGWNDKADGSGDNRFGHSINHRLDTSGEFVLYAQWHKKYRIGDLGPKGGTVYFDRMEANPSAIPSYIDWLYLELAPYSMELNGLPWGVQELVYFVGGTKIGYGDGQENTGKIIEKLEFIEKLKVVDEENPLASEPFGYNYAAYRAQKPFDSQPATDWYLPSSGELKYVFSLATTNPTLLTLMKMGPDKKYWSSSEGYLTTGGFGVPQQDSRNRAYACWIDNNGDYCQFHSKENEYYVRPIRRF